MKNAPIGIVDSGFGGLSIYKSIVKLLPGESTVYVGDHAYLPYGGKSKREIRSRVRALITFLLTKRAKMIVIACNTATIAGIDVYRSWFPTIPIIGVVPVVKTAGSQSEKKAFAILSTVFTSKSDYQRELIKKFASHAHVYNLGCPNLLDYVERGQCTHPAVEKELRSILAPSILAHIDIVVLGCTHYPFLRRAIRAIVGKHIRILDSGGAVARHVDRILTHNKITALRGRAHRVFYSTKADASLSRVASLLLAKPTVVSYVSI